MVLEADGIRFVEGEHCEGEDEIPNIRASKSLGPSVRFVVEESIEDRARILPTYREQTVLTGQVKRWGISSSKGSQQRP